MKYLEQHIATATSIIKQYDGAMPLSNYLKQHFAANKKYGGKDRKHIAHFCFLYFRLANATKQLSIEETIKIALFITSHAITDFTIFFTADWLAYSDATITQKLAFITSIYPNISLSSIFPFVNDLSKGIDSEQFAASHLVQPDLFLRIRPKQKDKVLRKLQVANIAFSLLTEDCLALPNTSKIDDILQTDREVVVQDYSSQRIAAFLSLIPNQKSPITVWDCCAASGGKSILVVDVLGNVKLTVSDIRATIIQNLKNRLAKAGIAIYHTVIADLTSTGSLLIGHRSLKTGYGEAANDQPSTINYQLIICDAPCTGSGTWGRTPEQLSIFKPKDIDKYVQLQLKISTNTIKQLAPGGYFLYITCSVFKQENEDIVAFILQQHPSFILLKQELLIGYDKKADSMFAALFQYKA